MPDKPFEATYTGYCFRISGVPVFYFNLLKTGSVVHLDSEGAAVVALSLSRIAVTWSTGDYCVTVLIGVVVEEQYIWEAMRATIALVGHARTHNRWNIQPPLSFIDPPFMAGGDHATH